MKPIGRPRRIKPDSQRYFQVDGVWYRRPFAVHAQQILSSEDVLVDYVQDIRGIAAASDKENEEIGPLLEHLHLRSPEYFTHLAAVIGLYWWDEAKDLEAQYSGDMRRFGADVLAELEDESWDIRAISTAGMKCFCDYLEDKQRQTDVAEKTEERLDFFARSPA